MDTDREAHPSGRALWVAVVITVVGAVTASAQTYEIVHAFRNSAYPASSLVEGIDGQLYGTTDWGGAHGVGSIYRIDSARKITTLHSFGFLDGTRPFAALVRASDGNFYGTTLTGGLNNLGTLFRIDPTGNFVCLRSFQGTDGASPNSPLIQGSDGYLYGTTGGGGSEDKGTVFRADFSGNVVTVHSFTGPDGASPNTVIQGSDGDFYGTTSSGGASIWLGTVFHMNSEGTITVLHSFDDAPAYPCGLMQAADGNFYGTACGVNNFDLGGFFKIDAAGNFAVLHRFEGGAPDWPRGSLIQVDDGFLYGSTWGEPGSVFRMDYSGNMTYLHRFNGNGPYAALLEASDGNFYGTTNQGGRSGLGTVFQLDKDGDFQLLHDFTGADLDSPASVMAGDDGFLYGTAPRGGANGYGAIFRVDSHGVLAVIHDFGGFDGAFPAEPLLLASDKNFYGTARAGGDNGYGVVFRLTPSGELTVLHSFAGFDGWEPHGSLVESPDGFLYGTTYNTVFKMDLLGNTTVLYAFTGPDGVDAFGLIQSGDLFGLTVGGGARDSGTAFRLDLEGNLTDLYDFNWEEEGSPTGGLVEVDYLFLGTTWRTIFRLASDGSFDVVHNFDESEGEDLAGLLLTSDAHLYGTTRGGGANGNGTIYRFEWDGTVTTLHSFGLDDGFAPAGPPIEVADGIFCGTAGGGPVLFRGSGVVYRLSDAIVAANQVTPTSGPSSGATILDVLGGGFTEGATVAVGRLAGTEVTVLNPTFLYLVAPALSPGTLNDVSITVSDPTLGTATATHPNAFFADFLDVSQIDPFHDYIEKIVRNGVTAGCGTGNYCPADAVTRAQMAVFLLKSKHGSAYVPPPCAGAFADVPCPSMFADWIEQLAAEGITAGCGGGNYCPASPVTRAQMAVFLLKTEHGSAFTPPACASVFGDVPCPSLFADWIEQLAAEEITAGCGGGNYCPDNPNTRGQMAAFLVKTFHM